MALYDLTPPPIPDGYLTLEEVQALLRESDVRVSATTLRRWRVKYEIDTQREGKIDYWDFSGVLVAEREERKRREAEASQG